LQDGLSLVNAHFVLPKTCTLPVTNLANYADTRVAAPLSCQRTVTFLSKQCRAAALKTKAALALGLEFSRGYPLRTFVLLARNRFGLILMLSVSGVWVLPDSEFLSGGSWLC